MGGIVAGMDAEFHGIHTDTRTFSPGALFVALRGARFDGHAYIASAARKGAAGAVVSCLQPVAIPQIWVPDTRQALGKLAAAWRGRFTLPVIAITGSNGKTTVKEITAHLLHEESIKESTAVLATQGNLNNEIGLPLTLLKLSPSHRYAVIEMGANHPGEIGYLAHLAQPKIAAITLCASAHLAGFGSLEGVAAAKGEIFSALPPGGTAVINGDDPFAAWWQKLVPPHAQVVQFSLTHPTEVFAEKISLFSDHSRFTLHALGQTTQVTLPLAGRHNIANALAATACALAAGKSLQRIVSRLACVPGVPGRLQVRAGISNSQILDDTYNANPSSLQAALEVLASYPGPRWLVLGNMGELGAQAETLHTQVGTWAAQHGVEQLWTLGNLAALAKNTFPRTGRCFEDSAKLAETLQTQLPAGASVLIKGSRSMRMETIVRALLSTSHT